MTEFCSAEFMALREILERHYGNVMLRGPADAKIGQVMRDLEERGFKLVPTYQYPLTIEVYKNVVSMVRDSENIGWRKIHAIKYLRGETGMHLYDAKCLVEEIISNLNFNDRS